MEWRDRGNTSTRARLLRLAIPFGVRPALSVAEGWLCHRFTASTQPLSSTYRHTHSRLPRAVPKALCSWVSLLLDLSSRPEWPIFLPRRSLARRPWSGGTVATLRRVARLLRLAILFGLLRLCRRFYAFNLITQVRAWHMHSRICFWVFRKIGMKGPAERRLPKNLPA